MIPTELTKMKIIIECSAPEIRDGGNFIQSVENVIRRRLELNSTDTVKIEVIR